MIKIIYVQEELKEVWDDTDSLIIGYDTVSSKIIENVAYSQEELDEFKEHLSVSAAESEGHTCYKILAIYDPETGWFDTNLYK